MAGLDEPTQLSPYDPDWPARFAVEASRIAAALPAGVGIEHFGSTAVPGLIAKPIVDIMIGPWPHHDQDDVRRKLSALGYEDLGEAGVPGRIYLRRRAKIAFNIALVLHGGPIWTANIALRDYLRADPSAACEYAAIKRAAIAQGAATLLAYSHFKSAILTRLVNDALNRPPIMKP